MWEKIQDDIDGNLPAQSGLRSLREGGKTVKQQNAAKERRKPSFCAASITYLQPTVLNRQLNFEKKVRK